MRRFDPAQVLALVAKERVEAFAMVPTMAIALLNCAALKADPKPDLSSLKYVSIGGAASSPELVAQLEKALGCACYSGYGLTETSPVMSMSLLKPSLTDPEEYRYVRQSMAGCSFPCTEIRVVDSDMNDVPCDSQSVGEVVTRGDGVMAGYWRQPESTADAFRGGWFHTGDLAVMDKDRYLLIVDRKKEIIVSGGENISSLEVEKALLAHPAVYECAVIPVPDDRWGEVPKGLVVLKPGQSASEAEIIEFARGRLAHYKVPKTIEFLAELPKSGTGKILKRVLREKYWEHLSRRVGT
jgi:fatty-acyl-CoA synthase